MTLARRIRHDENGATVIEMAFALPILILMIYMLVQLAEVYRAVAGMQHALGEGARFATLWPTPAADDIEDRIEDSVYGIGPGEFTVDPPAIESDGSATGSYYDLRVTYEQDTNLLLLPGPDISVTRTKRVWVAETEE